MAGIDKHVRLAAQLMQGSTEFPVRPERSRAAAKSKGQRYTKLEARIQSEFMTSTPPITRDIYPALRRARWRRWLVVAALVCMVGIYSIALTHHHKTERAELTCPVCQVMAHGAPSLLKPNLTPVVSYASWYRHTLPRQEFFAVPLRFNLKPQPRAPPLPAPSIV
ncbi:MAG: hypothetical protein WCC11_04345 [Gammaproteobacteria bacterium]